MFYSWNGRSLLDFRNWSRNAKIVTVAPVLGGAICAFSAIALGSTWFPLYGFGGVVAGFFLGIGLTCWLTARSTRTENEMKNK